MKKATRIIVAPNSYKSSIDSFRICQIIENEIRKTIPSDCIIDSIPIGDGGDGSAYIIARNMGAIKKYYHTRGPLGRARRAPMYIFNHTAIIEMADVVGLRLLDKKEYNPSMANTEGFGKLISKLHIEGITKLILCIGGSASIDMGLGALKGMGARFYDSDENLIEEINIRELYKIKRIDSSLLSRYKKLKIDILCDVNNTLLGENGAVRVFGKQKGVREDEIELFESQHSYMCEHLETISGKKLKANIHGGAAGGLTIGFSAFLDVNLFRGTDYILDLVDFNSKLDDCKLLISGEGCMDSQTSLGKAPYIAAQRAKSRNINCIALNGQTKILPKLFSHSFSLLDYAKESEQAIANPEPFIRKASKDIAKHIIDNNIFK
jgi:glycerate kinase